MPAPEVTFSHGEFFGNVDRRRELNGFILTDVTPAVPDRAVPRHTHEDAHFVLVLDGLYVTSAAGAPDLCPPSTLIFNPAGTTHRDRFQSETGRFFTLSVGRDQLAIVTDEYRLLPRSARLAQPPAVDTARRLAAVCARGEAAAPLLAEGLCWELLADAQPDGERLHTAPAWLRTAREVLRDLATEGVNLTDLAGTVGIHPIHLTRTFRRFYRCTPGDYLRRSRLERAAALLRDSRLPLADVALSSGFADQSHFSKAFTRAYAMTPLIYRQRWGRRSINS